MDEMYLLYVDTTKVWYDIIFDCLGEIDELVDDFTVIDIGKLEDYPKIYTEYFGALKVVPCIFDFSAEDGEKDQYEGNDAFNWVIEKIDTLVENIQEEVSTNKHLSASDKREYRSKIERYSKCKETMQSRLEEEKSKLAKKSPRDLLKRSPKKAKPAPVQTPPAPPSKSTLLKKNPAVSMASQKSAKPKAVHEEKEENEEEEEKDEGADQASVLDKIDPERLEQWLEEGKIGFVNGKYVPLSNRTEKRSSAPSKLSREDAEEIDEIFKKASPRKGNVKTTRAVQHRSSRVGDGSGPKNDSLAKSFEDEILEQKSARKFTPNK